MDKWNLVIDVARCESCHNCVLATKDEYLDNTFPGYSAPHPRHGDAAIRIARRVRGTTPMVDVAHVPMLCNHCDAAPCIAAAQGAITKRADGIVIVDPVKARGRKNLVDACPYGAMWWNEEEQLPQNWIFDAHLLDQGWKMPRCVQACPTGAMRAMKVSDETMQALIARDGLQSLRPEIQTQPRVHYRNLQRYAMNFIAGSVLAVVGGRTECAADARVVLTQQGHSVAETKTDVFGDFKFDGLAPASGAYRIGVSHPVSGTAEIAADLGEDSLYFADIRLNS